MFAKENTFQLVVRLAFPVLLISFCLPADVPGAGSGFVEKETWPLTMLASRAAFNEHNADITLVPGSWFVAGPLKTRTLSTPAFPEKGVDRDAVDKKGAKLWKQVSYADGKVHKMQAGSAHSTYLFREITAGRASSVSASLGSDDALKVFLNGKCVLTRDVARGVSANQDRVVLDFKEGRNELLLKVYNRSGDHGFYFSLTENPAQVLWDKIAGKWPVLTAAMQEDTRGAHLLWFSSLRNVKLEKRMLRRVLDELGAAGASQKKSFDALCRQKTAPSHPGWLKLWSEAALLRNRKREILRQIDLVNLETLKRAVKDLTETFPRKYSRGEYYLKQIASFEEKIADLKQDPATLLPDAERMLELQREALLSNPLLDFEKLLFIKRKANRLGLPQNWQGNCAIARAGYENELMVLSPVRPDGAVTTCFTPEAGRFVGDVDLHFDADRMLFSMPDEHNRFQIWELGVADKKLRQITSDPHHDVDHYDACYLPNGRIIFASTGCFQGIPCVGGGNTVANLYIMDADGKNMRQLCFDQDHNWCPTVLNNGRVLYSRWEYSDTPHYFSRLLFQMNPDGTNQLEFYGSNSFWPNSIFYARPIPEYDTRVVAVVSGHHGVPRMGELVIFDTAKGRHEADGVIQRIPGYGKKVEPVIRDQLVNPSWPKFLHPYPLSDKYFLVSCKMSSRSDWGLYLVDVFDNMLLLKEMPGYALFEPVPLRKTETPPVIPDKVDESRDDAVVYMTDIYEGPGLDGVPRGTVKELRLYEFHYGYPKMGGHKNIGVEGPWDVHRILGTVPVHEDGSAKFKVPANMPIAVQPLDSSGQALQVMRSWFVAMPGEKLSCVGCHERQNYTSPVRNTLAFPKPAAEIKNWYGPVRGFSFKREVQPVLDKYCVGCHNSDTAKEDVPDFSSKDRNGWGNFTPSYLNLHPYVRRPGPESDYHLQRPLEFHPSTSKLIQLLKKGHYNVQLSDEAWERLYAWIDLNVPDHGTWSEHRRIASNFHQRRLEMRTKYANRPEDPEKIPELETWLEPVTFQKPAPVREPEKKQVACKNWPLTGEQARALQKAAGRQTTKTVELGDGVTMELVMIPAGTFVMGSHEGCLDEMPRNCVTIEKPFWMGTTEVTTTQYQLYDPLQSNGYHDQHHKDHTTPGYPASGPDKPAIRISWNEAMGFTRWLSEKTGLSFSLPTEAQWEWASRAGSGRPFSYGDLDTDFSPYANLADYSIRLLAVSGVNPRPIGNPSRYQDFLPKDTRFNDNQRLMCKVAQYKPNRWGLYDMHGNVWEWTRTTFKPYPYSETDGRNDLSRDTEKVVRGGSWDDRPQRASASYRLYYRPYQPVYNVGVRVVAEVE